MAQVTVYAPGITVDVIDGVPPVDQSALVAALQAQVASLQAQVTVLTAQNASLASKIAAAQAALA